MSNKSKWIKVDLSIIVDSLPNIPLEFLKENLFTNEKYENTIIIHPIFTFKKSVLFNKSHFGLKCNTSWCLKLISHKTKVV